MAGDDAASIVLRSGVGALNFAGTWALRALVAVVCLAGSVGLVRPLRDLPSPIPHLLVLVVPVAIGASLGATAARSHLAVHPDALVVRNPLNNVQRLEASQVRSIEVRTAVVFTILGARVRFGVPAIRTTSGEEIHALAGAGFTHAHARRVSEALTDWATSHDLPSAMHWIQLRHIPGPLFGDRCT